MVVGNSANSVADSKFPKEQIPDTANLFLRVHRTWLASDGDINPGFFRNIPDTPDGGMSCDWDRYSTPEQTKQRAKKPELNGVLQFRAGDINGVPNQRLEHDPVDDNQAHSQVFGEKTPEVRLKFKRLCKWIIPVSVA